MLVKSLIHTTEMCCVYVHITEKRAYTFDTFIQIYGKHLHMHLNFCYFLSNHMQEIPF